MSFIQKGVKCISHSHQTRSTTWNLGLRDVVHAMPQNRTACRKTWSSVSPPNLLPLKGCQNSQVSKHRKSLRCRAHTFAASANHDATGSGPLIVRQATLHSHFLEICRVCKYSATTNNANLVVYLWRAFAHRHHSSVNLW